MAIHETQKIDITKILSPVIDNTLFLQISISIGISIKSKIEPIHNNNAMIFSVCNLTGA